MKTLTYEINKLLFFKEHSFTSYPLNSHTIELSLGDFVLEASENAMFNCRISSNMLEMSFHVEINNGNSYFK